MHWPSEQATLSSTLSQLTPHVSVASSLPSVQSFLPLHRRHFETHCPLEQRVQRPSGHSWGDWMDNPVDFLWPENWLEFWLAQKLATKLSQILD